MKTLDGRIKKNRAGLNPALRLIDGWGTEDLRS